MIAVSGRRKTCNGELHSLVYASSDGTHFVHCTTGNDVRKRAASTLAENRREAANIKKAWGHLDVIDITRTMGYEYLDACFKATDKDGHPRPRPEKGNKEMALGRLILEYGIRKGLIETNPLDRLTKNRTVSEKRYVTHEEMELAVETVRKFGGARLIVALALKTAWLCIRRSVESGH